MWHCALVSCTSSESAGLFSGCALFWCWASLCVPFTNSMTEFYFIMMVVIIIGNFMAILLIYNYTFWLSVTKKSRFCKCGPAWIVTSQDIRFECWIEYVTFGLLYSMFRFFTKIFYKGIPGFAADFLAVFGATCLLSTFWKFSLKR